MIVATIGDETSKPRLLLVEDEFIIRTFLAEELRDAGFIVVEAANSIEALTLLNAEPRYDLLITDIRLNSPMDGLQLATWVRETLPDVKIVIASANADLAETHEYAAVFSKPYNIPQLLDKIRLLMEG